jgi:hypothetical protein
MDFMHGPQVDWDVGGTFVLLEDAGDDPKKVALAVRAHHAQHDNLMSMMDAVWLINKAPVYVAGGLDLREADLLRGLLGSLGATVS